MLNCTGYSKALVHMISFEDFLKLDIRTGRVIDVELFPEARKPAYKLTIDFGSPLGIRMSSAQLTDNYKPGDLHNIMVLAVVNLPPRQIGPFRSEVLILGVPDDKGHTILVQPNGDVPAGGRLH